MKKKTSKKTFESKKKEKEEMMAGEEPMHSPMMAEEDEPKEYEVSDAAETLMKAEHIKKNKKLMPHVHKHLKNKKSAIESIADLREKAQSKGMKENFGEEE